MSLRFERKLREALPRHKSLFYRCLECVKTPILVIDGKEVLSFASFGVLGLQHTMEYIQVTNDALLRFGSHPGSARIFFQDALTLELETQIAVSFQAEAALIFPSATLAHFVLFDSLRSKDVCFIVNRRAHMSIHNALRFARIPKEQLALVDALPQGSELRQLLAGFPRCNRWYYVCDTLYGIDGSVEDLDLLCRITVGYGGLLYLDDSHATGLYGPNGAGYGAYVYPKIPQSIVVGTFAKGLGSYGAFAVLPRDLRDCCIWNSTLFLFLGPLPASCIAQNLHGWSTTVSEIGAQLREKLNVNAKFFARQLGKTACVSHIFYFSPQENMLDTAVSLFEQGVLVNPILFPAVPKKSEGFRVVVSALHTEEHLLTLSQLLRTRCIGLL